MSGWERRLPLYPKVFIDGSWRYPPEARAEARRLREQGWSWNRVARALGISSHTTIRVWLDPALAERKRANAKKRGYSYREPTSTEDMVECLECGRFYHALTPHLLRLHHISVEEYRKKYGENTPLVSENLRLMRVETFKDRKRGGNPPKKKRPRWCRRCGRHLGGENVIHKPNGSRACRHCVNERTRARRKARWKTDPAWREKRLKKWRDYYSGERQKQHQEQQRVKARQRYASDPEYAERIRKETREANRRKKGVKLRSRNAVRCLECGELFLGLQKHLPMHGLNTKSYRAKHGPEAQIVAAGFRRKLQASGRKAAQARWGKS